MKSFPRDMQIASKKVGRGHKPFLIAEMSGNHNQSLERALHIVRLAAESGADALKIQTYTADTMTLKSDKDDFVIRDKKSLWNGEKLYDLYGKAYTPWEWHKAIFDEANKHGLLAFSSPFDVTAVDFLETLNVPCYKIASFEITHIPLLRRVAQTKKPVFISTGMASECEISEAIKVFQNAGNNNICIFKCTSAYPSKIEDANLNCIPSMIEKFGVLAGLSDHTMGMTAAIASVALGAVAIEKHFCVSRAEGGVDSAFSMEPAEFLAMSQACTDAQKALGDGNIKLSESEKNSLAFRQSIYISKSVQKGEVFSESNVRIVRPGFSLPPKDYEKLLGKKAKKNFDLGDRISWEDVE